MRNTPSWTMPPRGSDPRTSERRGFLPTGGPGSPGGAGAAWIGSENFGEAGFPPDGGPGNRGWSVVIEDPVVAWSLRSVFDLDFDPRRRDSRPAAEPPPPLAPPPP